LTKKKQKVKPKHQIHFYSLFSFIINGVNECFAIHRTYNASAPPEKLGFRSVLAKSTAQLPMYAVVYVEENNSILILNIGFSHVSKNKL
jgi:hypothetical protein